MNLLTIAILVVGSAGCRETAQDADQASLKETSATTTRPADAAPLDRAAYYERAAMRFASADFIKPDGENVPENILAMSPLIVREVAGPFADLHFGTTIELAEQKTDASDMEKSVIYYHEDDAMIAGMVRKRIAFLWLYDKKRGEDFRLMRGQGFRMTLDDNGFALFWEVLSPEPQRVIYSAQSVEDAAAIEFGEPAPDRRFSVERPIDESPSAIVPRILADGPQPMGPFVYVEGNHHDVTTLLCRCMPSQVEDFRKNAYFELRRLPSDSDRARNVDALHELLRKADETSIDQLVRVPSALSRNP